MLGYLRNNRCIFLFAISKYFFYIYLVGGIAILSAVSRVLAERVSNEIGIFSGLDKITGRVTSFEVHIGQVYQYGALQIIPRVCYTSSENEPARTTSFVEVNEMTLEKKTRRIFTGWMFADSPGLNAVEHSIYDVWLKDCKKSSHTFQ
ncbi:conserved protein of unknown function [Bartonella clarridgeiae 73]|uniref:Glycosyl hydrolase family 5 n=1 Tax=Bartonella clarridgeiae (strain CCUG 45776 / CIP 104772 / 73) TaxID=696125 RepID=E6YHF8_BARC7|nr:DUF2155 domain-containing protein [Bartonella clarridgeiae]WCR55126.1 MAG: hypothetical protein PG977_000519 [Bartonella clarridgeiae]CBI76296.1 conserved protein of unknown function [Bartonella clarridgeiae 73]